MKVQAEINGETRDVEITRDGNNLTASVDGRAYVLDVSEPERDVFLLKNNNKVSEAVVSPSPNNAFHVRVAGNEFDIKIIDPKRLRGSAVDGDSGEGASEIRTAMPGKVVRIVAPAGTEVTKGDGIIVVEAMKMQNEMKSPKDGTIREIRVAEGDNVNAGDILVVVE